MIIFVGDKPSLNMRPNAKPFEGASCEARFYEWIKAILPPSYLQGRAYPAFKIVNSYCGEHKEYMGYGWPFVALGNNASKALKDYPHFKLPHPSGRNRQINNKSYIEKKLKECRKWLKSQKY